MAFYATEQQLIMYEMMQNNFCLYLDIGKLYIYTNNLKLQL